MPENPAAPAASARLDSIDLLRGLVMVVMALDHVRDFFHFSALQGFDPLDLAHTTPAIFLTRLVTHFCAPIFSFLAGLGVWLALSRGRSPALMSRFLITRGLWLMGLELTVLLWFGWGFHVDLHFYVLATLWALGWSMIVLAGLIHLPRGLATAFCLVLVAGHNALDGLKPEQFGAWSGLWKILHAGGSIAVGEFRFWAFYPLLPWIGLMGLGYCAGPVIRLGTDDGRRRLVRGGLALLALFAVLRAVNVYGNLQPWQPQATQVLTVLSFLDVTKYPPSLDYVLLTIGTGLLLLAWFDRTKPAWARPLLIFGRVPFFYYLLHIPLIHGLAWVTNRVRYGQADFSVVHGQAPAGAGVGLVATWLIWIAAVAMLYPLCRWFADYKARHREKAWLSYF